MPPKAIISPPALFLRGLTSDYEDTGTHRALYDMTLETADIKEQERPTLSCTRCRHTKAAVPIPSDI
jgi:hypothetical protein